MFINSLKKSVRAVAGPATCDGRAAVWGGQAHRNAAETAPALAAKQTHLCPRHRRARRLFSPSPLSGGESAFLPHSDTCRVLQPVLGNGLAGPVSFCWKNWLLSSSPWFHASTRPTLEVKPIPRGAPCTARTHLCRHEATRISDEAGGGCAREGSPAHLSTGSSPCTRLL